MGLNLDTFKQSNKFGILIEVGAGMPVYNELCKYPNTASKHIYYAESPNNWQYNISKYNHELEHRAISAQICNNFIDKHIYELSNNLEESNVNFILTNTIQISNDKSTETHGWFGYYNFETKTKTFYHFYIDQCLDLTRTESMTLIADIGISILADKIHNCIDIILDEQYNPDLYTLLKGKIEGNSEHQNTISVIDKHNNLVRLTDYLRKDFKELCVMKGSFNPIHDMHINMLEQSKSITNNSYGVFCISLNHRHKDKINIDDLMKRIHIINELGYAVFIDTIGYYHNNYESIINNVSFKNKSLRYVLGTDVLLRLIEDIDLSSYTDIDGNIIAIEDYSNCRFSYLQRNGDIIEIPEYINMTIEPLNLKHSSISSTQIRKALSENQWFVLESMLSKNLFTLYKKYFYNK